MIKPGTATPCYKCEERHLGCHGSCEEYKAFKWQLELERFCRKVETYGNPNYQCFSRKRTTDRYCNRQGK